MNEAMLTTRLVQAAALLEKLRHELTIYHGLYATDLEPAYTDELDRGCLHACFGEYWQIETKHLIAEIDQLLQKGLMDAGLLS